MLCIMLWLLGHWWVSLGSCVAGYSVHEVRGLMLAYSWIDKLLEFYRPEGGLQNGHSLNLCPCARKDSSNGCHNCLCSQGKSHLHPACLGGSPRSQWTDPGFFQITASVLQPKVCEILCTPFKSGFSISYSPLALLYASLTGSRELLLLLKASQAGELYVGLRFLAPWGKPLQLWLSC